MTWELYQMVQHVDHLKKQQSTLFCWWEMMNGRNVWQRHQHRISHPKYSPCLWQFWCLVSPWNHMTYGWNTRVLWVKIYCGKCQRWRVFILPNYLGMWIILFVCCKMTSVNLEHPLIILACLLPTQMTLLMAIHVTSKMKFLRWQSSKQKAKEILPHSTCSRYQMILQSVLDSEHPQRLFFISAAGGYGKTFLMETLLSTVHSMGKIALAVTSSGIAAELSEVGRTAHSHFKIPIPICDEYMCSISLQSTHAQLIKSTSLICWDEILMSNKQHIECVDRSLWDIPKVDNPFGGITCVFGGDPHQILPVLHHGNCSQIVKACVESSHLWNHVHHIQLMENMRVDASEVDFSKYPPKYWRRNCRSVPWHWWPSDTSSRWILGEVSFRFSWESISWDTEWVWR